LRNCYRKMNEKKGAHKGNPGRMRGTEVRWARNDSGRALTKKNTKKDEVKREEQSGFAPENRKKG